MRPPHWPVARAFPMTFGRLALLELPGAVKRTSPTGYAASPRRRGAKECEGLGTMTRMHPPPRVARGRGAMRSMVEHLWWQSSIFGVAELPEAIFVDEGIGQDGELSGDGDEGD